MPLHPASTVLFLDYDGVLHPDEVYLNRGQPELRAEGYTLFQWAPLLIEALGDYPSLRIVLSTSWAREVGFHRARQYLPPLLQQRTIAATWHSAMGRGWPDQVWWDKATRYEQIARWAARAGIENWIALDDQPTGWPESEEKKLVRCNAATGLSAPLVLRQLSILLSKKQN